MKTKIISHTLKLSLLFFLFFTIVFGVYVLPSIASTGAFHNPELSALEWPLLIYFETLLILFGIGILLILYVLRLFDKGDTFTHNFTNSVKWMGYLCLFASISLAIVFVIINSIYGSFGIVNFYALVVGVIIFIIGLVILLIHYVIKEAMIYKEDVELTV